MSLHCSRKSFLAKLGGMFVGLGTVPSLLAKIATPAGRVSVAAPATIRPEQRAVSRKEGSY